MVGRNVGYQEEERRCGPGAASLEEEAFEGLGRRGGDQGAEGRRLGQSVLCLPGIDSGAGLDATGPARERQPCLLSSHRSQPRDPQPAGSSPRGNWRSACPCPPPNPKLVRLRDEVAWTRSLVIRAPPVLPTVQGQEWGCEWRERRGPKGEGPVLRPRV